MSIFHYLMEMAMVNSYILYRKAMKSQNLKHLSHYKYRLCIITNLVKSWFLTRKEKNQNGIAFSEKKN